MFLPTRTIVRGSCAARTSYRTSSRTCARGRAPGNAVLGRSRGLATRSTLPHLHHPLVQSLSRRPFTVLYEVRSPTSYILGCYAVAGFCFAYASINLYTVCLDAPQGLKIWVSYSMGGVCFMMICFGTYCAYRVCYEINRHVGAYG